MKIADLLEEPRPFRIRRSTWKPDQWYEIHYRFKNSLYGHDAWGTAVRLSVNAREEYELVEVVKKKRGAKSIYDTSAPNPNKELHFKDRYKDDSTIDLSGLKQALLRNAIKKI